MTADLESPGFHWVFGSSLPYNLWHGTDAHCTLRGALRVGFPKITYLTRFESLDIVFMKPSKRERNMNAKKNKYGDDYLGVFFRVHEQKFMHVCVCVLCRVLGISVMVGAWPFRLLQRCSILIPAESSVNPHFTFPCPNTRLHLLLCKQMHKDICLEFLALNERWWLLYDTVMFICHGAFLYVPAWGTSSIFCDPS